MMSAVRWTSSASDLTAGGGRPGSSRRPCSVVGHRTVDAQRHGDVRTVHEDVHQRIRSFAIGKLLSRALPPTTFGHITTVVLRPERLALYIAASARLVRVDADSPGLAKVAPILTVA